MKANINLKWVEKLDEVGAPIRDQAREIEWRTEQANQRLKLAIQQHENTMAAIERDVQSLEAKISRLWSVQEIEQAKQN